MTAKSEKSWGEIAFLYRKPHAHQYSIEDYFARVQEDLTALGVENHAVTSCYLSRGLLPRLKIAWQVLRRRDWLLHITGDITFAALVCRGKVAITIHDTQVLSRLSAIPRMIVSLLWFELPIRRADLVTVNSEETARCLRDRIPAARGKDLHVVPVSVSEKFRPSQKPFNAQKPRILQIGTKPNKNVGRLVEALREVECTLCIVGPISEALRQRLEVNKIEYDNLVNITKKELVRVYEDCDLLAFASIEEGFGMPIVEAQRIGRPIVTSSISSMPEVAGNAACFVDPTNVDSIRAGLTRVIEDEYYRNELVSLGFVNVERFERRRIAERYWELYRAYVA
ncbi:glycosyltransferase family 4 protein [Aurantiacibacter rhizosphaerae]|uniref:Glycosyltransferase n=1 Tax=Aurantiacibacter rhizosphaerae TaxID=2691582 RepID=A0A844XB22_9SPHN|nr:glycosyltransferase family 1 protein [Aurantiacibacter rhizosphaerae]MWV26979.1 glycosyltransferase [Aurantiacibacter rhizosphaerae]